jgi:DNA-binding MarR family transcriptional regulator
VPTVTIMRGRDIFLDAAGAGSARPAATKHAPAKSAPAKSGPVTSGTAKSATAKFAPSTPAPPGPAPAQAPGQPPAAAPAPEPGAAPAPEPAAAPAPEPGAAPAPEPGAAAPLPWPPCEQVIGEIESALHSLARSLRQGRLHEFLLAEARIDVDQAGLAVLYVLHVARTSLRLTDVSDRLHIDAPAVTRKAQQLERSGLVSRTRDGEDARATRLQLTAQGRRTISRFLTARKTWLSQLLDGWPEGQQADLARLLCQFAGDVHQHLRELDS